MRVNVSCTRAFSRAFCRETRERNETNYANELRQCSRYKDLSRGRKIHSDLIQLGYDTQTLLGTLLVQMYGHCGCLEDAVSCYNKIRNPITFSANVLLTTYAQNGNLQGAINFFKEMQNKDMVSYNTMISVYSQKGHLHDAKAVFNEMPHKNVVTYNSMITAYAQRGDLLQARNVFDNMNFRDVVTQNAMLAAYLQQGYVQDAEYFFHCMPVRNLVSWNALLTGYAQSGHLQSATKIFQSMPQWSEICWNAMISGFCLNRRVPDARKLFDRLPFRGMISWICMIQGYTQNGHLQQAWEMFKRMPMTDVVTWTTVVTAFAQNGHLQEAESLFEAMPNKDITAMNAMVATYGLYGDLEEAKRVFLHMESRDLISWNSLITAYVQNGYARPAIDLFKRMAQEGVQLDSITFIGVLDACTVLAWVNYGKLVHEEVVYTRTPVRAALATALLNFYGKCGRLQTAVSLFNSVGFCDTVLVNAMLGAYAQNGEGKTAISLFLERVLLTGIEPDVITFVSVMSGCSHAGLVREGFHFFVLFSADFGLPPMVDHYSCVVDLLARTGLLSHCEDLLFNMPYEPEYTAWRSLLRACQSYGDVLRGKRLAVLTSTIDASSSAAYVMLSNLFNASGRHEEGGIVRKAMEARALKKPAGLSAIAVKGRLYEFIAGDERCHQMERVHEELRKIVSVIKEAGYMPDTSSAFHGCDEEEKENVLGFHSEKLAIAFGIINTALGQPLYIVKNLRVCSDCHSATKFISKVFGRQITVRDAHRFHHFKHGSCSCGDFW